MPQITDVLSIILQTEVRVMKKSFYINNTGARLQTHDASARTRPFHYCHKLWLSVLLYLIMN